MLNTDASGEGLSAVLHQQQDGVNRVIAYASRSLSKAEKNYPVHKLEFLALKSAATEKFHDYFYGNEFTVMTDNNPLTYVLSSAKLDATGHRWVAQLANYHFALKYCTGTSNRVEDALSRVQWPEVTQDVIHQVLDVHVDQDCPVKGFCFSQQAIPSDLEDNPDLPGGGIDWSQELRKNPVISEVTQDVIHQVLDVHVDQDCPVEGFCFSQQAIPSDLEDNPDLPGGGIDWSQELRKDPVISEVSVEGAEASILG